MKKLTHSPHRHRAAAFITCAAIIISLIALILFSPEINDFDTDPVYASVFRLHIRANSDSRADQETKLAVRDALLPFTAELFRNCNDLNDAVAVADLEKDAIISHIDSTLSSLGADYSASVKIGREHFPERSYGGEVYPEGEYTALIVELGEGEGQNWWCVLFPSLCLSAAKGEDSIEVGLTPEQFDTILSPAETRPVSEKTQSDSSAPKYRIKFKFLELICELFDR
ncbi:MAG: stage II sporulation protein R [Clostridia bacterium]|nr:stage II sporulation protein R [Clostridia bacterium]